EPGGAKKPSVRTVPTTRQNAGLAPAAGVGVAETTVTFETWRAATASTVQAAAACARAGTTTAPTKIERAKASRDDPAIMAILLLLAAGVWARRARLQHRPTVDVCQVTVGCAPDRHAVCSAHDRSARDEGAVHRRRARHPLRRGVRSGAARV